MNKNIRYFERLHELAKAIVDGGSADAATAAALRTATMELAERYSDPEHALKQLYSAETELGDDLRQAFAIVTKDDGADDDAGDITNQHPVVQAARLLVASGRFGDHGQALDYLLNTATGQALL